MAIIITVIVLHLICYFAGVFVGFQIGRAITVQRASRPFTEHRLSRIEYGTEQQN